MPNPGGNYPGRQIGIGALKTGEPAFFYFGSGRSKTSQERYATSYSERESGILIEPIDPSTPFDPFRHHYHAVRVDTKSGLVVLSNSEAPSYPLFEAYNFRNVSAAHDFLCKLLEILGPEYDNPSNPTPRIVGVIFPLTELFDAELGITAYKYLSPVTESVPLGVRGKIKYVQTYDGNINYGPFDPLNSESLFDVQVSSAQELADEIYDMSDYIDPQYGELRVWCIAGIRNGNGPGGWEIARRNRHNVE